jgi:hypothetical protein
MTKPPPKKPKCDVDSGRIRGKKDRLVTYVLQADPSASLEEIQGQVERCLAKESEQFFPGLLETGADFWDYHEKVGKHPANVRLHRTAETLAGRKRGSEVEKRQRPDWLKGEGLAKNRLAAIAKGAGLVLPIRLREFYADREKKAPGKRPNLGRVRFVVLTLPYYESTFRRNHCKATGRLYDFAYALAKGCGFASVSPSLAFGSFTPLSGTEGTPCADDLVNQWHLPEIGFATRPPTMPSWVDGRGVLVGHPDTGWTPHPELNFTTDSNGNTNSPNIDENRDINILDPNSASAEELVPSPPGLIPLTRFRYHGTRTASLIVSSREAGDSAGSVSGVAPGATLVSIRCVDGVIQIGAQDLADAVMAAVDAGAQVLSISLGGYTLPSLHWAIDWAVANDVIVVAAAGNYWPVVVYPAAYPSCIAVGGSEPFDRVWRGSSRNHLGHTPIDIGAPAACIRNAWWSGTQNTTPRNEGTSFATAMVAGAAALWLQRFNRNVLLSRLGGRVPLQELFRAHLAATARRPTNWNTQLDGPGILNLTGLMSPATMPPPATLPVPAYMTDSLAIFGPASPFFDPGSDHVQVPGWLEAVLGPQGSTVLDNFGEEVANLVLGNPLLGQTAQMLEEGLTIAGDLLDQAAEGVEDVVEDTAEAVEEIAEDVGEAVEDFVNEASETVSDTASTVAGWLGF